MGGNFTGDFLEIFREIPEKIRDLLLKFSRLPNRIFVFLGCANGGGTLMRRTKSLRSYTNLQQTYKISVYICLAHSTPSNLTQAFHANYKTTNANQLITESNEKQIKIDTPAESRSSARGSQLLYIFVCFSMFWIYC